jgi:hypothetical protein
VGRYRALDLNALIAAEEYGVTSANLEELAAGTNNPEINRLLGTEGNLGAMFGLDANGRSAPSPPAATMARSSPPTSANRPRSAWPAG